MHIAELWAVNLRIEGNVGFTLFKGMYENKILSYATQILRTKHFVPVKSSTLRVIIVKL